VTKSDVVVDAYDVALAEAGDLLLALEEGKLDKKHIRAELGEIVLGLKPGRQSVDDITLFKSCGVAFEDAVCAQLAYERAREAGLGQSIYFGG
jgi:ornithine cyclodeaminase/alanine dehydrogenase-like protein (mu-crystallin family)